MNTSMLNFAELNTLGSTSVQIDVDFDILEFDGFSLQPSDASIVTKTIKADSLPSRELSRFNIPRGHGGKFIGDYFRERTIRVEGVLRKSTNTLLEQFMDEFKRRVTKHEGNLDWKVAGEVRRIQATLSQPERMFSKREYYHITVCPFELEFISLEPFWHDKEYTSATSTDVTSLVLNGSVENLGTFEADMVLVVIVNTATAITGLNLKNTTNSGEIQIDETISAGDVIVIDGENRSVTINGSEVDYDGIFPVLDYGTNTYTITSIGTAISYTPTVKFRKTYL